MKTQKNLYIMIVDSELKNRKAAVELLTDHTVETKKLNDLALNDLYRRQRIVEHSRNDDSTKNLDMYDIVINNLRTTQLTSPFGGILERNIQRKVSNGLAFSLKAAKSGVPYVVAVSDISVNQDPGVFDLSYLGSMNLSFNDSTSTRFAIINSGLIKNPAYRTTDDKIETLDKIRTEIPDGAEPVINYRAILDMIIRD
jgi:hypothetical protein